MTERHEAIRTCIGCRSRAPHGSLVRYVLTLDGGRASIVPDDGRGLPGRGAWLHDDEHCRQLAVRRRAFRRALRIAGDVQVDIDLRVTRDNDGAGQHVASPERQMEADGSRR